MNEIYSFFTFQLSYLTSDKQMILKLEESFRKREKDLFNMDKLFKNIFSKFPDLNIHQNKNKDNNIDEIVDKIKEYKKTLTNTTDFKITIQNLQKIGISKNDIRNIGGIKNISDTLTSISLE
jgi:predicted RNA-binding protein Jag